MKLTVKNLVIYSTIITFLTNCGAEPSSSDDVAATTEETTEEVTEETSKELTDFKITAPGTTLETATPTVTWEESDYSETTALALTEDITYDLIVASDSGCATAVQEHKGLTETTKTLDSLAEGKFYVCVTASTQGESKTASNNAMEVSLDLKPASFTLASVSETQVQATTASVEISWGASANASHYKVTIDGTEESTEITGTSATVSVAASARSGTSHTVLIKAYDAEGNAVESNSVTFAAIRLYSKSELQDTYSGTGGRSKGSNFDADMLLGIEYTCTIGSTVYPSYLFSDIFIVDNKNTVMSLLEDITGAESAPYNCVVARK